MEIVQNFPEARLLANLDYDLLNGIWRGSVCSTTELTQKQRTKDNTNKSENDQLRDNQKGKVSSDDGTVKFRVGQTSHILIWAISLFCFHARRTDLG
jgi:hypothetical protein